MTKTLGTAPATGIPQGAASERLRGATSAAVVLTQVMEGSSEFSRQRGELYQQLTAAERRRPAPPRRYQRRRRIEVLHAVRRHTLLKMLCTWSDKTAETFNTRCEQNPGNGLQSCTQHAGTPLLQIIKVTTSFTSDNNWMDTTSAGKAQQPERAQTHPACILTAQLTSAAPTAAVGVVRCDWRHGASRHWSSPEAVRACCTRFLLLGSLVSISKSHLLHAVVQHIQSFDAVAGEGEEVGQPPQLPLPPLDLLHACMIPNRDA